MGGWLLDVVQLKSILPGLSSMKFNTALCFVLAGLSLTLSKSAAADRRARRFAQACALTVGAVGLLTLTEYASGRSFGFDQLLVRDATTGLSAGYPGRMGISTALCFVLLGIGLYRLPRATWRSHAQTEICALTAGLIASISLIGYAYSIPSLTGFASYTQMAVHTTVAFLVLSLGAVAAARGPAMSLLLSPQAGGLIARHLLPTILLAPPAIGWVVLEGRRAGLYEHEFGAAMIVASTVILLGGALLSAGKAVNRADEERKRAVKALTANEARLRHVLASSTVVIYATRLVGQRFIPDWVSENIRELLGYDPQEALLPTWWEDHLHSEDRSLALAGRAEVLAKERLSLDYRLRDKQGHYRWVHEESRVVRRAGGGPAEVFSALVDVTEQKRLEGQYQHAQRMEVVGRLAGGVAHDFNNLLTVITSVSDLLLLDLERGHPMREDVGQIKRAAENAARLTQQLLAFSRRQMIQPRAIDLRGVVVRTEALLKRLIGEDVELVTRLDPNLGVVRADLGQMEQVITNLAVNARDAMPDGGKLTIATTNADMDEAYVRDHSPARAGRYVLLSVSDTGMGMDEATRARLFEPYFTTKDPGKGTGLGLATVYGIVKQAGGFVWVYSEPGQGATFKVYLPRIDEPADPQVAPFVGTRLHGNETVLVVEDQAPVRTALCRVLERHGYTVIEAADGDEALRLATDRPGPIQVALTDIVMPNMGGGELGRRLLEIRPDLRIVYMSGYPDAEVTRHGVLETGITYLEKPFTLDALLHTIRAALDEGSEAPEPG